MKYLILDIITQTTTFRNPEFQNFHKTLNLPPPTTIIGFAGAALGLSPNASQNFFDNSEFKFGVTGISSGKTKDTWKYANVTSGEKLYNYHPNLYGSVITKEILFNNHFSICFGTSKIEAFEKLKKAFFSPKFALTLGNSDSVAFIKKISETEEISESNYINNCIIEGNVIDAVFSNVDNDSEFSIYETSEPICYDLPIRFKYKGDYDSRKVLKVSTFSFIGNRMQLNFKLEGIWHNQKFIPVCKL